MHPLDVGAFESQVREGGVHQRDQGSLHVLGGTARPRGGGPGGRVPPVAVPRARRRRPSVAGRPLLLLFFSAWSRAGPMTRPSGAGRSAVRPAPPVSGSLRCGGPAPRAHPPASDSNGCPLIIWTEFELVYLPYLSVDLHQTFNTDALGH